MKFSEIQKKEVIDATKGTFLGYVQDATINVETGAVESLHIGEVDRNLFFDLKTKDIKKVRLQDISIIGKDIVLVGRKDEKK